MAMFNKETEYALRALVYIQTQNEQSRKPGVAEIAKKIEAPPFFIAKILQRLVRSGFITSLKGKGGGFFFEKGKSELPLKELIINIEGEGILTRCGFGLNLCDNKNPCPLHEKYTQIRNEINELVANETIQSLANKLILK